MAGPAFLTFRPFSESDWWGWAGAGADAEIGYCGAATFIVCRNEPYYLSADAARDDLAEALSGVSHSVFEAIVASVSGGAWVASVYSDETDAFAFIDLPNAATAKALCAYVAARGGDPLSAAREAGFTVA